MNYNYGTCESIKFLENIAPGVDLCEIVIDFDTIKIFYSAPELAQFVGHRVQYTTRPDVIRGQLEVVICEIAKLSTIQTVKSIENIKLIPEGNTRTVCNFSSKDIRFGEFYPNRIAYLSKYELGSSPKSKWIDCTMIDKDSREFQVRIFTKNVEGNTSAEDLISTFVGKYVQFNLESTKYGYQTQEINALMNDVELSPEVLVAKEVILNAISNDVALTQFNDVTRIVERLESVIDGEPGYALVRIASEIYMINAIDNISRDLDIQSMRRAAICSRGYLLPSTNKWSRSMMNINKILKVPGLKEDRELLFILDTLSEEEPSETKQMYIRIRGLVNDIIDIRRGNKNEKDIIAFSELRATFNGLL